MSSLCPRPAIAGSIRRPPPSYGFEVCGLDHIIAAAFVDNSRSRRVLERIGMTYTGETAFSDRIAARYVIRRDEYVVEPETGERMR